MSSHGGAYGMQSGDDDQVTVVGESVEGSVEGQPTDRINLVVGRELAVRLLHRPVPDALGAALAISVDHLREFGADRAKQAGLLVHLAECAFEDRLAGMPFALRQRPVAVPGAMDEQDLQRPSARRAPHDPTGGIYHSYHSRQSTAR